MTKKITELQAEVAELKDKRTAVLGQIEDLTTEVRGQLDPGQQNKLDELQRALDKVDGKIAHATNTWRQAVQAGLDAGHVGLETEQDGIAARGQQSDLDPYSHRGGTGPETALETRGRALKAIERWNADDDIKQSVTKHIERADRDSMRGLSEHVLRFGNPDYVGAFRKYSRDPETFAAELTPAEHRAWGEARDFQRATLGTSGAVLPSPLDPTIVLTNAGDIDPMRAVARIDSTTSTHKRYITSAGATFSFDAELAEVSDDTPTETEVQVDTEKAQGWIEASIEVAMDQPGFDMEITKIIADGKARLEAVKWIDGTGTNEPKGIVAHLTGTASEIGAAGEDVVADDVYGLLEALPPRWRQSARWQLELSTINHLHRLWNPTGDEPPLLEGNQLIRRPFLENSNIDPYSDIDAAATATHRPLVVGDWQQFVILDRVGMTVAFVGPGHLHSGTNNRPDGRVGWYAYWRTGSKPLTINAFRMLKVTTAA